jgi:hypothetical protein
VKSNPHAKEESTYYSAKKQFIVKDGLSETSIVLILQRMIVSNFARLMFVSRENWIELGDFALEYLRKHHPILAGGIAGARLGSFSDILKVC